jgi:diguanylate cyclase (GGDEF)-like protein
MRISTLTNWAYGVTVVLTAMSGAAFIMASRSAVGERIAVEEDLDLASLSEELALGAEVRTDQARLYVMRGEDRHLQSFRAEEESEQRRVGAAERLLSRGLPAAEVATLKKIDTDAEALDRIEVAAVEAYQRGNKIVSQEMMFGPEHDRMHQDLLASLAHFQGLVESRTGLQLDAAQARSDWWSLVARIVLGLTGALFLGVLYFILRRRVAMPLVRMTGIVGRLAKQDYTVVVPADGRRDEIGEMTTAIEIFRANGLERDRLDAERQADQQTKDLILQMMHRLQACQNQDELADVVARFAPQIFPGVAGGLYILNESRITLHRAAAWLAPNHSPDSFPASTCWGLRRGRPHASGFSDTDIPCQHLDGADAAALCVPLTAQGDMIGLLYLEENRDHGFHMERSRLYLELIAENLGLAIANLQLREKLTVLAIHDPLTGLFNRRHLDETLRSHAGDHGDEPLTCMMIDIDRFKRFNDQHGHDAGDMVMQHVGQTLRTIVGEAGAAYRYGGEEFTVLLPGTILEDGIMLAEQARLAVRTTILSHAGNLLGQVTISLGVAASPDDGTVGTLLARADAALLQAKAQGRDRVVAAQPRKLESA